MALAPVHASAAARCAILSALACAFAVASAAGCSSRDAEPTGFRAEDGGGSTGPSLGGDDEDNEPNAAGCSEAAKLVYVLGDDNALYSFKPSELKFTRIGALDCNAPGASPNSMAVGRDGTAWLNYTNGRLYKVNVTNAACASTDFAPRQAGMANQFGMGFSSDTRGSSDETLFIADISNGKGLGKVDLKAMTVALVGDFTGSLRGQSAELTGTGDGRLYGFFTTEPDATLAQIDKTTGATSDARSLFGVRTGTHWAFSFWGGDFWFYTADVSTNPSATSSVTQLKMSDGSIRQVVRNLSFRIVGAGVSTCAPTEPPK